MAWYNDFWDNVCDAADNCGEMFSMAGESFANGNIMGGLHQGFLGVCSSAGNVITLGGANALGNAMSDYIDSDGNDKQTGVFDAIRDVSVNALNHVAKSEAESMLMQDDLVNGVYNEYKYDNDKNCYVIDKDEDGNLKSYKAVTKEEKDEFKKLANTMGAVDVVGDVVDVVTAGYGGKAITAIGKKASVEITQEVVEQTVKTSAKQGVKYLAKEGVEEVAEQGVKYIAKEGTKQIAKEGVEEVAEQGVKYIAKEGTKQIAKEGVEEVAEQGIKYIAKEGTKQIAKEGIEDGVESIVTTTTKTITKDVVKDKVEKGVVGRVGNALKVNGIGLIATRPITNRVLSGETVADTAMNGLGNAVIDATKDTAGYAVGQAETVVSGVGATLDKVSDSWLSKHPVLARFVNTCKSAYYASTKSFTNNKVGALAVATVSKPLDKVKSFISSSSEKYEGMSINEMANQFKAESTKDNKKWTDHYVERVKELDAELGLDSSTRSLVAREDSVSSDAELGAT